MVVVDKNKWEADTLFAHLRAFVFTFVDPIFRNSEMTFVSSKNIRKNLLVGKMDDLNEEAQTQYLQLQALQLGQQCFQVDV